jgi:hypothetical protein
MAVGVGYSEMTAAVLTQIIPWLRCKLKDIDRYDSIIAAANEPSQELRDAERSRYYAKDAMCRLYLCRVTPNILASTYAALGEGDRHILRRAWELSMKRPFEATLQAGQSQY